MALLAPSGIMNRRGFRSVQIAESSIPQSGLSLWLKADAGVSKLSFEYVSQIVLSGGYGTGTYDASTVPNWSTSYNNISEYSLGDIYWSGYGGLFYLPVGEAGSAIANIQSYDGITWEPEDGIQYYIPPTISGVTGDFAGANGSDYSYNDSPQIIDYVRGSAPWLFYINGDFNNYSLSAYNGGDYYSNIATCVNGVWTGNIPETANISGFITRLPDPNNMPTGSITTSTANTDYVTEWADQSGNGKNMTSSSGNEPTFIASELNGKPVIDFEGSKYLTASFASINFTQQTVFIVFKFVSANLSNFARPFSQSNIDYNDHETPENFLPLLRSNGTDDMWCYSVIDSFLAGIPTSDNTWYISTTKTDGSNGSFFINASNEQAFSITFDANITNMQVGGALIAEGGIGDPFNSKLAEVIVYDRNLTTPERQQVEAYLNTKYAIY